MKRQALALVLALALLLILMAGCSGGSTETQTPAGTAAPATQTPAAQTPTEAPAETPGSAAYPLVEEPAALSLWAPIHPFALNYIDSLAENTVFEKAAEITGVYLEANSVNALAMVEQFSIMIAGGDYPDMIGNVHALYAGGMDAAVDQGVCLDVADYLESCMPNYVSLLERDPDWKKAAYTDEGRVVALQMFTSDVVNQRGLVIRQDYLDQVDMAVPETYDELHDVLAAFQDYLVMLNQWYAEGLIFPDFMADIVCLAIQSSSFYDNFLSGEIAVALAQLADVATMPVTAGGDMTLTGMADVTHEKGEALYNSIRYSDKAYKWALSTSCEDVEMALRYLDFFYTEEGALLNTYGVEGVTFNYDENGEAQFTEMVMRHEAGTDVALALYCGGDNPGLLIGERVKRINDPAGVAASEIWDSNLAQEDRNYPESAALTADEADDYSSVWTDVITYAEENIPKFIIGELDPEADFEAFTAQLYALGLQTCIDLKQAAFDRYLAK